jgi:hypothetical protein
MNRLTSEQLASGFEPETTRRSDILDVGQAQGHFANDTEVDFLCRHDGLLAPLLAAGCTSAFMTPIVAAPAGAMHPHRERARRGTIITTRIDSMSRPTVR